MKLKDLAKNILMGLGGIFLIVIVIAIMQPTSSNDSVTKTSPIIDTPISKTPEVTVQKTLASTQNPTPTPIPTPTPVTEPIIVSGKGQKATDLFYLQQGLVRFEMEHNGESNFIIQLLDEQGLKIGGSLVNEIGSFQGSKAIRIEKSGMYLMDIMADGNWKVTIK